jgi:hypothetical protein
VRRREHEDEGEGAEHGGGLVPRGDVAGCGAVSTAVRAAPLSLQ